MAAARTVRTWGLPRPVVVGLVGPDDVKALQTRVHDYQAALQVSVDALAKAGKPLASDNSQFSIQSWGDIAGRVSTFEGESTNAINPAAYIFAGSAYERGRQLIDELDSWRDHIAGLAKQVPETSTTKVPVPDPVPVPHSDIGLGGGIGIALVAVVAILVLREMR